MDLNKTITALGGKKFIALIAYLILTIFQSKLGLTPEMFERLTYTIMTFLGAQGLADGLSKGATSHKKK